MLNAEAEAAAEVTLAREAAVAVDQADEVRHRRTGHPPTRIQATRRRRRLMTPPLETPAVEDTAEGAYRLPAEAAGEGKGLLVVAAVDVVEAAEAYPPQ